MIPTLRAHARRAAGWWLPLALLATLIAGSTPAAYALTLSNNQAASLVLGQANFTSNAAATAQNGMSYPAAVAEEPGSGKMFVSDYNNNRVLRFASLASLSNGANAEAVLGQANYTSNTAAAAQNSMYHPVALAVDSAGRLWVADAGNSRVLRVDSAATKANGSNADGVLGQPNYTSNTAATTQSGISSPFAVSVDSSGRVYVADAFNNRVLWFNNAAGKANGANADGLLGQANYTSNTVNAGGISATSLSQPALLAYAPLADVLLVPDANNNRVLRYSTLNTPPTISNIADRSTNEDTTTTAIPFSVSDAETAASSLTVTGSSSNTSLVSNASIVFGGSGTNRTVTITPAAEQSGTATITVTVSDGSASSSTSFVLTVNAVDDAPVLTGSGSTVTFTENGTAVAIDPALTLTDVDGPNLTGATVTINSGFASGQDVLQFTNQLGITGSYNATSGVLTLSGSASVSSYQTALRSVTYRNSSDNPSTAARSITFSLGQSSLYLAATGHYYEFISSPTTIWSSARSLAAARSYYGLQGYLVTMTSAAEQSFIQSKLAGSAGWMGASDATTEGNWRWVTGPEGLANGGTGTQFWQGLSNGTPTPAGSYTNWNSGEPNQYMGWEEDYGQFVTSSKWNDLDGIRDSLGYVVEYGGMPGDPALSLSSSATVNITAVNDAPVNTVPGAQSVAEDTNKVISGLSIADLDAGSANVRLTLSVANGTLTVNTGVSGGVTAGQVSGNGSASVVITAPIATINVTLANGSGLTYRGTLNYNGSDTLTVITNDQGNTGSGGPQSDTDSVAITVTAVNDAPVASNGSLTTDEDTPASGTLLASDVDNAALTYSLVANGSKGVATITNASTGAFTYTPNPNANGTDSFTFKANDGSLNSNIATVTITVTAVNDAPVAANDSYSMLEDGTLTIAATGVLANDSDVDGDSLTAVLVSTTSNGTLTLNANGSFTYTPNANFNSSDSFTYKANDGALNSNVATVTITIAAVNDAPVASNGSLTTDEDTLATGTLVATDVDGDALTYSIVATGSKGVATITDISTGAFTYTPNANTNGSDSFTYKVHDGTTDSNIATVTITITAVNDAPVAADDSYTTAEDSTRIVSAGTGVLTNDSDVDGDSLTTTLVSTTSNGTLTLNADGSFDYTPAANFNGSDSFTYKATDGNADSNVATVTITVTAVNDAPIAVDDSYTTDEDSTLTSSAVTGVLANDTDVDGDPLTAVLVSTTSNGTLTLNADGSFSYTPNADYNGSDSFTYRASDGTTDSNITTVTIAITTVNDAPVASDGSLTTAEDTAASGMLVATDADGDALTYSIVANGSQGTATITDASTGAFTYTSDPDATGSDSFTFKANDGTADSNVATVTITITPVNDAPSFTTGADQTVAEDAGAQTVSGWATSISAGPANESGQQVNFVVSNDNNILFAVQPAIAPDGTLTYTPAPDAVGSTIVSVQAQDDGGTTGGGSDTSAPQTFTITVTSVNDAPSFTKGADQSVAEDAGAQTVSGWATTISGGPADESGQSVSFLVTNDNAALFSGAPTIAPDGTLSYTPAPDAFGNATVSVQAQDTGGTANGGSDTSPAQTFVITVTPENDNPVAVDDSFTVAEDSGATALDVLANDTSAPDTGETLTVTAVTQPVNGTVTLTGGVVRFAPAADFTGSNSFTYTISDGNGGTATATVTMTVTPVNDAPMASDGSLTTDEDSAATGTLVATDADGDALTYSLVTNGSQGVATITDASTGAFTYTPNPDANGSDSFTFKVHDGTTDSNIATVTITITPVNDAPVAANDSYSVLEDSSITSSAATGVLANDSDVDGDPLAATVVSTTSNGTLTLNSDGSFEYTPNANFNGSDSFTYSATDGTVDSNVATVTITVASVNDAPVASDDSFVVAEDSGATMLDVLANDTSAPDTGETLTVTAVTQPANGTVTLVSGVARFTPNADYTGTDSFIYTIADGNGGTASATVTITITSVNDAPVTVDDSYTTDEDTPLTAAAPGVLANDTDVDGDPLTASVVSPTSNGTLTLNTDGSFDYTPNANFNGSDSFTYTANDGNADSNVATVTLTVAAVNDAPTTINDSYTTDEDNTLTITATGVLANDSDVDGDTLTATVVLTPTHGTLTLNSDGSFSYTPDANYTGSDSFTYKANDGTLDSNVATVTITINTVNDAPVAVDDSYTTAEDSTRIVGAASGVLTNDSDLDGDSLTSVLVSTTSNGTLTLNADGSFSYTPNANFNGTDSFTYTANDGTADSNIATVTITITAVNDTPVANDSSLTTDEDTPASGTLSASDVDGDALTYSLVTNGSQGTVIITDTSTGAFTYTPNANATGSDSFTFKVNDGTTDSNIATVTITITPTNDAPIANDSSLTTAEDTATSGTLFATDADGDALTYSLVTTGSKGTVIITDTSTSAFSYTPDADATGSDSFTFKVNDGTVDSNVATVTITITPVNDTPVAADDSYMTDEDTLLTVAAPGVLTNDTDVEGDSLTATLVSTASNGMLTLNADGSFDYTPDADFNGSDSFTYTANDGTTNSNVATVTITITAVNDAPSFTTGADQTVAEDAGTQAVSGWATSISAGPGDESGQSVGFSVTNDNAALFSVAPFIAPDGTLTYTPAPDAFGNATVTVQAQDDGGTANGGSDTSLAQTFTITVTPVNDAPLATDDSYTTDEDTLLTVAAPGVLTNDSDVEGDSLTATVVNTTSNGTLTLNADGSFDYTPDADYTGTDSFTYTANDGTDDSNVATVTITITPENDAPVASDGSLTTDEDTAASGSLSATDADGDALTYSLVSDGSSGTVTLNADGTFTYMPDADFNGTDSFTYTANDGTTNSNVATVTITINAVNDAPVANDSSLTTAEDTAASGTLVATDTDGDTLTYSIVANGSKGNVTITDASTGVFSYTPDADGTGSDSFTFKANDGTVDSNVATVMITITAVGDAPTATFTSGGTVDEGGSANVSFSAQADPDPADVAAGFRYSYDFDGDGTFDQGDGSYAGGVTSASASIPAALLADGPAMLTVRALITDQTDTSSAYTATFTIANVAPLADAGGPYSGDEGDTIALNATATDPGQDTLSYAWDLDDDGQFDDATGANTSFSAAANGSYTIRVQVSDEDGASSIASATVTVGNVSPLVDAGGSATLTEGSTFTRSGTFSDPGDSAWTATVDYGDGTGVQPLALTADKGFDLDHAYTDEGDYTVRVQVSDGANTGTASVLVQVTGVAPTATFASAGTVDEGSTGTVSFSGATDPSSADVAAGFRYSYDFDDDGTFEINNSVSATVSVPASYLADGPQERRVRGRIADKDGLFTDYTVTITVVNVAPTVDAGGPYSGDEGDTIALHATATDPGQDTLSYAWDLDNDGQFDDATGADASFSAATPSSYTVTVRVTDDDGASSEATATVTVTATATTEGNRLYLPLLQRAP